VATPSISVAVPAYNAERWIGETLESVLVQTSPPLEVVVVDDGSTDGTRAKAECFGDQVRVIGQENRGAPGAYNRAFRESLGDYVAMCPADDLWEPRKLEWQGEVLRSHPEVDIVFGKARSFGLRDEAFAAPPGNGMLDRDDLLQALYEQDVIPAPTAVVRRALHARLGGFREDIAIEDYEFWFRALRDEAVFYYDARLLVRLRQHSENLSSQALTVWELNHQIHTWYAEDVGDADLVRRVLSGDLRRVGRCRLGVGQPRHARAAFAESYRHRRSLSAAAWVVVLSLPGAQALFKRVARRRRPNVPAPIPADG
jgi:glycosyltransferase involved in cell wall biosynthesis